MSTPCAGLCGLERRGDRERPVLDVDDAVLAQPLHPREQHLRGSRDQLRTACDRRVEAFEATVVDRKHVVLDGLDQPEPLQRREAVGVLRRQVMRLRPVVRSVVQLPDVVVEGRQLLGRQPGRAVPRDGTPPLVVDAAVPGHLEVLQVVALGRGGLIEAVEHARALDRRLRHAVHHRRARAGRLPRGSSAPHRSRG